MVFMRFTSAEAFIAYCVERRTKGRFGLTNFKAAMEHLGQAQLQLKTIHIAGTNGKGSTTNYLRSILQQANYRVGTFTSPHLVRHHDRIRINDVDISDEDLLMYGNRFYDIFEQFELSMFEIDTLIATYYFLDQKIDYALYEVGLGGRLDATNIIHPILSIITTIGYDHMDILGHTLEEIALEKAGIIKPSTPLLTGETKQNCLDVFALVCAEQGSSMSQVQSVVLHPQLDQVRFNYRHFDITLSTQARYQSQNASIALEAALMLRAMGLKVSDEAITQGLRQANWKGRFECMSIQPSIYIDGAHNTHGIEALCETLVHMPRPISVVFTALRDKDTDEMIVKLLDVADQVYVTEFDFYRAARLEDLSKNFPVIAEKDPYQALKRALASSAQGTCMVTGSLYFISEMREKFIPELLKEIHSNGAV
jgi:dihydrofolate synthase / folylpolyglutamate synthase